MKHLGLVLAALVACVAPVAASSSSWRMTAASNVQAFRTRSGILITANVELANNCYEAAIQHAALDLNPWAYNVVTRVKPADVGKICAMVAVPSVARGSFVTHSHPKSVIVHATNGTVTVLVRIQTR